MNYISTRGASPAATFETVLLSGLAPDGGLYMPEAWARPERAIAGDTYAAAAKAVMGPYISGGMEAGELDLLLRDAYACFDAPEVAPVREIGPDLYLLELFHGPTLAFKDFAMQVLARLMERTLLRTRARTTILAATSGDTGAAAVEAFRGRQDIELFVLYPHGRISDVQRKQMTTASEDNVHVIALEGTFDDAQAIVKHLFNTADFRTRHALSAINSINWARIIAQAVYYFTATAAIGRGPLSFSVPTGNFGDIFAGYTAAKMGLGLNRLVIATNENDILVRALDTGRYQPTSVHPTDSPSMDIQVSSNFERLMFEACGRNGAAVLSDMDALKAHDAFEIADEPLSRMRKQFSAHRVSRNEAAQAMAALYRSNGVIVDPHTAIGLAAANRDRTLGPTVVLATAHPAKFPEAVRNATGVFPDLPASLERCMHGKERFSVVPNAAGAVANFMDKISSATGDRRHAI